MRRCNNLLNRIFITRRRMTGYSTNAKFRQRTVSPLPSHYNKNKHRICPPFEKKTFILDFVNSYEDIVGAFAPYYTTTLLSNSVTPTAIYDLEAQIDAYAIIDPEDVDKVNEILYKEKVQSADKKKINFCLDKSQKLIEHYSIEKQREIVVDLRHFVRFYEFMRYAWECCATILAGECSSRSRSRTKSRSTHLKKWRCCSTIWTASR